MPSPRAASLLGGSQRRLVEHSVRRWLGWCSVVTLSALALTGELPMLLMGPALTLALLFVVLPSRFITARPPGWLVPLLVAGALFVGSFVSMRHDTVVGVAIFLILVLLLRLYHSEHPRHQYQALGIAAILMTGAAAMTVSLWFGFVYPLFVFTAMMASLHITCLHDASKADVLPVVSPVGQPGRMARWFAQSWLRRWQHAGPGHGRLAGVRATLVLPPGFTRIAFGVVGLQFALTVLLFLYIPRLSATNYFLIFQRYPKERLAGFDEGLQLGGFESIQRDDSLVLRVFMPANSAPDHLRLTGVALNYFDGVRWSRGEGSPPIDYPHNAFDEPEMYFNRRHPGFRRYLQYLNLREYTASFQLEPGISSYIFLPTNIRWMRLPPGIQLFLIPNAGAIQLAGVLATKLDYTVSWQDWHADGRALAAAAQEMRVEVAQRNTALDRSWQSANEPIRERGLHLPANFDATGRIRALATEITDGIDEPLARAHAIEQWLRLNCEWTTRLPAVNPKTAIEQFLFDYRQGHCEFFAASMVVMCRMMGVPARIMTGYYSDDFTPQGYFAVRQENAHAWVEVFDDMLGWVTFEPTPANGFGSRRGEVGSWERLLIRWREYLTLVWYGNVVDYGFMNQRQLFAATRRQASALADHVGAAGSTLRKQSSVALPVLLAAAAALAVMHWRRWRHGTAHRPDRAHLLWRKFRHTLAQRANIASGRASTLTARELLARHQLALASQPQMLALALRCEKALETGAPLDAEDAEALRRAIAVLRRLPVPASQP